MLLVQQKQWETMKSIGMLDVYLFISLIYEKSRPKTYNIRQETVGLHN